MNEAPYQILAFYYFGAIDDPLEEVRMHKEFFASRDIRSRIYISEQGINAQMSIAASEADEYKEWLHSRFPDVELKCDQYHEHVFPRACVKYRKQLVALDADVDLSQRGSYLTPQKWVEKLESDESRVLLDVRNDYEWKVGHFKGAELPGCSTFREFNDFADQLQKKIDPKKTPVMMYCTGGIRCELYSAALKMRGFENVHQLKGGVIGYGHEVGSKHWMGKLFVFDDRMTTSISEESTPIVSTCSFCPAPVDHYFNCANMDCNDLFLCCQECLNERNGCCSNECKAAFRVRPLQEQSPHKPFRKKGSYQMTSKAS